MSIVRPSLSLIIFWLAVCFAGLVALSIVIGITYLIFDVLKKIFTWVGAIIIIFVSFMLLVRRVCEIFCFAGSNLFIKNLIST